MQTVRPEEQGLRADSGGRRPESLSTSSTSHGLAGDGNIRAAHLKRNANGLGLGLWRSVAPQTWVGAGLPKEGEDFLQGCQHAQCPLPEHPPEPSHLPRLPRLPLCWKIRVPKPSSLSAAYRQAELQASAQAPQR